MISRIYNKKVEIDTSEVNAFFEQRNIQESPLSAVMLRPSGDDGIAEKRNEQEAHLLNSMLEGKKNLHILDLGCGMGRWIDSLTMKIATYTGVDFTKQFIESAKGLYNHQKNYFFYHSSVTKLPLQVTQQQYNLIIVNGLCPYLNDNDLDTLCNYINLLLASKGNLYFRESISVIGERLTLKNFFSETLQSEYSAIYRTPDEYELLFSKKLTGLSLLASDNLLNEATGAQKETNQKYWFFNKK